MKNEMIEVSKHDLYKLLDSAFDEGCDKELLVVDRDAFMKLHKMFKERFDIHCGYINEDE